MQNRRGHSFASEGSPLVCIVGISDKGFLENGVSMRRSPMSISRLCFSFQSRRMLFSTLFLYALCMGLRLCAGWVLWRSRCCQFSVGLVEAHPVCSHRNAGSSQHLQSSPYLKLSLHKTVRKPPA